VLPAKGRYHETGIEPGHVEYLVLQMPVGPSGCNMTILNLGQYGPSERRSITHSAFRAPRVLALGRSHGPYPRRAVAASQSSPELRYRRTP
jgi:hypothetical protein